MTQPTRRNSASGPTPAQTPPKQRSTVNSSKGVLKLSFPSSPKSVVPAPKPVLSEAPEPAIEAGDEQVAKRDQPKRPKQDRRTLKDQYRTKILNNLAEALGVGRTDELPAIFLTKRIMPMKIGILEDLMTRYPEAKSRRAVKKALRSIVRSIAYSNAILEEERRYDLDLNPVFDPAGDITEQNRQNARANIKYVLQRIWDRKKLAATATDQ